MHFEISLIQLFTVCAIINGFVFAVLLLEKKENRKANRFLSLMILCLCLTFTPFMLDPGIWDRFRWLAWVPFSFTYWIGPAFYFYIKTLTEPARKFLRRERWHFAPLVLNYVHSIYHAAAGNSNPWPWFHHFAELLQYGAIFSIIAYMVLSYQSVSHYQITLLNRVSNTEHIDLKWIRRLVSVIVGSFMVILIFLIISRGSFGMDSYHQWDLYRALFLLLYSIILYWISISGFRQAQTLNLEIRDEEGRSEAEKPAVINQLQDVITTDGLYKNPELSLSDLSRITGISQRAISDAINGELNKNFYQFINEYRVEELKNLLKDPARDHLKILSLAMEAGFNSKASFNRVFKAYTGKTPKEYKSSS